jgi:hypothetical protein
MELEQTMEPVNILGDDFARAAAEAGLHARIDARRFELRLQPQTSRDSHIRVLRELPPGILDRLS